jgi:RNA-binding protein YlmH
MYAALFIDFLYLKMVNHENDENFDNHEKHEHHVNLVGTLMTVELSRDKLGPLFVDRSIF